MADQPEIIRLAYPAVAEDALSDIAEILRTGRLTKGEFRKRFEVELARVLQVKHAVTFNSGTSALLASLSASGVGPGDHVAVPDYGFYATADAVMLAGATPVFVDVDDDFNLSPDALARIDEPIKAVVVVHQFGLPAALKKIKDRASNVDTLVIEDSACAIGTTVAGQPLACDSPVAIVSFHPRKIVTTGEGGALLSNDEDIAAQAVRFGAHSGELDGPSMNLRLAETACAMGLSQLRSLDERLSERRRIHELYRQRLSDVPEIRLPKIAEDVAWNVQTLAVVLDERFDAAKVVARMATARIECNRPAFSLSAMLFYREHVPTPAERVANSRKLARHTIALPCHEQLTEAQVDRVCRELLHVLGIA